MLTVAALLIILRERQQRCESSSKMSGVGLQAPLVALVEAARHGAHLVRQVTMVKRPRRFALVCYQAFCLEGYLAAAAQKLEGAIACSRHTQAVARQSSSDALERSHAHLCGSVFSSTLSVHVSADRVSCFLNPSSCNPVGMTIHLAGG